MKTTKRTKQDQLWLKRLGNQLYQHILASGYISAYDFWIQKAGDKMSRSALNYILNGEVDVKITTLKTLANLLDTDLSELLEDL